MHLLFAILSFLSAAAAHAEEIDIYAAPHLYLEKVPQDRFSKLKPEIESGKISLDRTSEHAFLRSLLNLLEVPVTSQMLVFSTTSLQLSLISPRNPRAIYFNEDTYVGYIPGGKIEIISLDPELGGIFYIFDIPRVGRPIAVERSSRCMNCHSGSDSRYVPGLVIKSVVAGPRGGSLDAFRTEETGHSIPLSERFGGWYLTGAEGISNHWGNAMGRMVAGEIQRVDLSYAENFDAARYPVATSDLLAHLLHEHQAGFVNRVLEGGYVARQALHRGNGKLRTVDEMKLQKLAREITRYILFADEAPLPAGAISGDPEFRKDFLTMRRMDRHGRSLKDWDLGERLFRHRCSYMIYSPVFHGLPERLRKMILLEIAMALNGKRKEYAYLGGEERAAIRSILSSTFEEKIKW